MQNRRNRPSGRNQQSARVRAWYAGASAAALAVVSCWFRPDGRGLDFPIDPSTGRSENPAVYLPSSIGLGAESIADALEQPWTELGELLFADAAHPAQLGERLRLEARQLAQRGVVEDHEGRHAALGGNRSA